jgi:hypothetical protein
MPLRCVIFNFTFIGRNIACGGAQSGGENTLPERSGFFKIKSTLEKQT